MVFSQTSPTELLLTYPLWFSGPERRRVPRTEIEQHCRYAVEAEGDVAWLSGTIKDVSIRGVRLVGPIDLPAGTSFLLRMSIPGHPLPLLIRAKVAWSSRHEDLSMIGARFEDLSFQAEAALVRAFGPELSSGGE